MIVKDRGDIFENEMLVVDFGKFTFFDEMRLGLSNSADLNDKFSEETYFVLPDLMIVQDIELINLSEDSFIIFVFDLLSFVSEVNLSFFERRKLRYSVLNFLSLIKNEKNK